jgi:hypothetical protein
MSDSHSFNATAGENESSGSSFWLIGFQPFKRQQHQHFIGQHIGIFIRHKPWLHGWNRKIPISATLGTSEGSGTSQTTTQGTSRTAGKGRNETVHRRPLIQPDEVGRFFARWDDRNNPLYPGLALVMVTGANPLMVRRTHYFEDLQFIDCFSPHPDHKFIEPISYEPWDMGILINGD